MSLREVVGEFWWIFLEGWNVWLATADKIIKVKQKQIRNPALINTGRECICTEHYGMHHRWLTNGGGKNQHISVSWIPLKAATAALAEVWGLLTTLVVPVFHLSITTGHIWRSNHTVIFSDLKILSLTRDTTILCKFNIVPSPIYNLINCLFMTLLTRCTWWVHDT